MYVGLDPGKTGAIAILRDGALVFDLQQAGDSPDIPWLRDIFDAVQEPFVIIERQIAMPKQGVSSTFTTGRNYGMLLGALAALRIPHETVHPSAWKKVVGIPAGAGKDASRALAQRLFPEVDLHLIKHHGRAEALLLAEWGRRTREGKRGEK